MRQQHFFKIMLSDIVSNSKLMIPRKFVRKYGEKLLNRVLLKAPTGALWPVDLERADGDVWLQNGWPEFAKYYSICFGHLLVFQYDGHSHFHVVIFDSSASEIDYLNNDILVQRQVTDNIDAAAVDESFKEDDSRKRQHEVSDESARETNCLKTCKKTRANYKEAKHGSGECQMPEVVENTFKEASFNKRILRSRAIDVKHKGMKPMNVEHIDFDIYGASHEGKRVGDGLKMASEAEKARALASAKVFKSHNPFFIVVVYPSYAYKCSVTANKSFVERYITNEQCGEVVLQVSEGRTWAAKFVVYSGGAKLCWNTFARDNSLSVGDVCVFELINPTKKLLTVVIFRAGDIANS